MPRKLSLEELDRINIEEFKAKKKTPINVVLDDIRSALNVGSFFRTCDALAINHLYLCGITATPPHKEILKTAIGAHKAVDWSYHSNVDEILSNLRSTSKVYAIEQTTDSVELQNIDFFVEDQRSISLIFGNEVNGVNQEIINQVDGCIEIPQFGTKHSLNVAVCGGIVLWEAWKQSM